MLYDQKEVPLIFPNFSEHRWCRLGPIFREVKVRSIDGGLDVDDLASNQHDSNPATATPRLRWLLIKHNLIDLSKKAFSCKRIEEHKQESINAQSEIASMNEAKVK